MRKQHNYLFVVLSSSLGFSVSKNIRDVCESKGQQRGERLMFDVRKSRMMSVVKMSVSRKGFIS